MKLEILLLLYNTGHDIRCALCVRPTSSSLAGESILRPQSKGFGSTNVPDPKLYWVLRQLCETLRLAIAVCDAIAWTPLLRMGTPVEAEVVDAAVK